MADNLFKAEATLAGKHMISQTDADNNIIEHARRYLKENRNWKKSWNFDMHNKERDLGKYDTHGIYWSQKGQRETASNKRKSCGERIVGWGQRAIGEETIVFQSKDGKEVMEGFDIYVLKAHNT